MWLGQAPFTSASTPKPRCSCFSEKLNVAFELRNLRIVPQLSQLTFEIVAGNQKQHLNKSQSHLDALQSEDSWVLNMLQPDDLSYSAR